MLGKFIWQGRDVDRLHLSSLLRNASVEQQEHVEFHWLCFCAAMEVPRKSLPADYGFKRWYSEHTQPTPISADYMRRVRLCGRAVANIAKEHGELIEVAWLFELLSPS
jgi:hypothetical protein